MIDKQKVQGDVLFTPCNDVPKDAVKLNTRTVAYGEATGHHHTLDQGDVYTLNGQMWVVVPEGATVLHQEHGPLQLDSGVYQVDLQIEVDPWTGMERRVID